MKKLRRKELPISRHLNEMVSGTQQNVVKVPESLLTGLQELLEAVRGKNDLKGPARDVLLAHLSEPQIYTPGNRRQGAEHYWRSKLNLILNFCLDIVDKDWERCCQDEAPADAIAA